MKFKCVGTFSAVVLLVAAGCGSGGATVTGNVTVDGQPLAGGQISFLSEGGQGGTGGSPISGGKYQVADLPPGKYHVHIDGEPPGKIIAPGSPEAQRKHTDAEIRAMSDPFPVGTTGRDETVELAGGSQTKDFALTTPKGP